MGIIGNDSRIKIEAIIYVQYGVVTNTKVNSLVNSESDRVLFQDFFTYKSLEFVRDRILISLEMEISIIIDLEDNIRKIEEI